MNASSLSNINIEVIHLAILIYSLSCFLSFIDVYQEGLTACEPAILMGANFSWGQLPISRDECFLITTTLMSVIFTFNSHSSMKTTYFLLFWYYNISSVNIHTCITRTCSYWFLFLFILKNVSVVSFVYNVYSMHEWWNSNRVTNTP